MEKTKLVYCYSTNQEEEYNSDYEKMVLKTIGYNIDVVFEKHINYGEFSLTEVYNKTLDKYFGENIIIIFAHNDIIFNSYNWGNTLLNYFNYSEYGIIGVAGTTSIGSRGIWWEDQNQMTGNVWHMSENNKWLSQYSNRYEYPVDVVSVDGLFFAVNCERIKERFNEDYKDFHYYDITFCVDNFLKGVDIGVVFDIRITHKSIGAVNEKWESNREQFVKEYTLPISLDYNEPFFDIRNVKKTDKDFNVCIIIPTKNNVDSLVNTVNSIIKNDDYNKKRFIIADTGSDDINLKKINDFIESSSGVNIKIVNYDYYNFAKINNDVVVNHTTIEDELILFCNDDIVVINNAVTAMVEVYKKNPKKIGTVGGLLLFGNNRVQHSGIFINKGDNGFGVGHYGYNSYYNYYEQPTKVHGNTGAFLLTSREKFTKYGMFNENYAECFEDVEYNLSLILNKFYNVIANNAVAYHYESTTRKKNINKNIKEYEDYLKLIDFLKENERDILNYSFNANLIKM